MILPEVFRREVCEGFDYRAVARALLLRGHLGCEQPRLTKKPRLPEVGAVRVYAVKSSILWEQIWGPIHFPVGTLGTNRRARNGGFCMSPLSPVVRTKKQMKPYQGGNHTARRDEGRFTIEQDGNGKGQAPAPSPRDCLRTRQAPADCQTCGTALVTIGHTPMGLPGSHCSKCCPCCAAGRMPSTGPGSEEAPGKSNRLDLDSAAKSARLMSCGANSRRAAWIARRYR